MSALVVCTANCKLPIVDLKENVVSSALCVVDRRSMLECGLASMVIGTVLVNP
jgi:hypothetical protein